MLIIPAIDLQGGQAVRLYKGDYAQKTVYSLDPAETARGFEAMGAKYLHVVDLDGARRGSTENIKTIGRIRESVSIPIQVGGGIRGEETVALYLRLMGIDRVILGTAAARNPQFAGEMAAKYGGGRIVAGVDAKGGRVAASGWLEDGGADYLGLIEKLKAAGIKYAVVTDISRDGTLTSPNWEMYERISGINVIVSGGVSCRGDIEKAAGYYGVIVGKAYYEGKVDLEECLKNV